MLATLQPIAERVAERMAKADLFGRTVTLKIKHADFTLNTRQHTRADAVHSAEELMALARWLLHTPAPPRRPVRLLGLTASNFGRSSPAAGPGPAQPRHRRPRAARGDSRRAQSVSAAAQSSTRILTRPISPHKSVIS